MNGWKPEVDIPGEGWKDNGIVFATEEEAATWARNLLRSWFVPTDSRAVPTDKEPNYRLLPGGNEIELLGGREDGAIIDARPPAHWPMRKENT